MIFSLRKIALGILVFSALLGVAYLGGLIGPGTRQASVTELDVPEISISPTEFQADLLQPALRGSEGDSDAATLRGVSSAGTAKAQGPATERNAVATAPKEPDAFVIRVLDFEGQGVAGMSVELRRLNLDSDLQAGIRSGQHEEIWETDQRGRIEVPGFDALLREPGEGDLGHAGLDPSRPWSWALRARFLAQEPVLLFLTEEHLQARQVELHLPPSGSVRVEVFAADGKLARDAYEVRLRRKAQEEDLDPSLAFEQARDTRETDASGSATFPAVGLGVEYIASAKHLGAGGESRSKSGQLSSAGEVMTLQVDMTLGHPVLAYRAVSEQGEVLKNTRLKLRRYSDWGGDEEREIQTDGQGNFFLEVDRFSWFVGTFVLTSLTEPERTGSIQVEGEFENGIQPQGDIILREPGRLASGVVLDPAGRGVAGAQVLIGLKASNDDFGIESGPAAVEVRSGADGSFVIEGERTGAMLELWAVHGEQRSEVLEVATGATDQRLELQLQCRVTGSLLVPQGGLSEVSLRLVPKEGGFLGSATKDSDGHFEMVRVRPGTYAFECWLGATLLRRDEVEVRGATDLGTLDLTELIHPHRLSLLGRRDIELEGLLRWKGPQEGTEDWSEAFIRGEQQTFWSASREIDFELFLAGQRKASGERVAGELLVHLEPPLLVRLILETDGPLPELPYLFRPTLYTDDLAVGRSVGSAYFTKQNREILLELPKSGAYRVTWRLKRRVDRGSVEVEVLWGQDQEIEVLELGGEQVIKLKLDGSALEELVRSPPI